MELEQFGTVIAYGALGVISLVVIGLVRFFWKLKVNDEEQNNNSVKEEQNE